CRRLNCGCGPDEPVTQASNCANLQLLMLCRIPNQAPMRSLERDDWIVLKARSASTPTRGGRGHAQTRSRIFRQSEVLLEYWQPAAGIVLDRLIFPSINFLLKRRNILAVISHHRADVNPIERTT